MRPRQPLPSIWLVSDARNDAVLERALKRLPRGSGVVFRHFHLQPKQRSARLEQLARLCRRHGHRLEVAGLGYGPPAPHRRLTPAHSLREIGRANRFGVGAVLLSPVFATRSHPGAKPLGALRFRLLAAWAQMPVIALGGMTARRARSLGWPRWAAIDGLSFRTKSDS
ncbi:MAG: thiamine phosphate synthase [Novosphingobium sp.]